MTDCAIVSHHHRGISYEQAFYLTPFEKDIIVKFIEEDMERDIKLRAALFGAKV